jgi:hypothetical protein
MKVGLVGVSGITRVVVNRKVVWNRMGKRWVLWSSVFQTLEDGREVAVGRCLNRGMSCEEMHDYLNDPRTLMGNDLWIHGDTINVVRCSNGN